MGSDPKDWKQAMGAAAVSVITDKVGGKILGKVKAVRDFGKAKTPSGKVKQRNYRSVAKAVTKKSGVKRLKQNIVKGVTSYLAGWTANNLYNTIYRSVAKVVKKAIPSFGLFGLRLW